MKIEDIVYGDEKIKEEVLIELINCKSIQRLRGLAQYWLPDEYYHKKGFSRYEHSIGVLIFLRKLGAGLDEQIAGLLHDVSHTAFSHVVDWVIGDPTKEDHQDKNHLKIIENSEIPRILRNHFFDYRKISELERFSLLERETPGLCADRVDYALREIATDGEEEISKKLFSFLGSRDGNLFFNNVYIAEEFGRIYSNLNKVHWAGVEARTRYYLLANILKRALNNKIISREDLYKTDLELIDVLYKSKDGEIIFGLDFLKNKKIAKEGNNGNGIYLRKKYRWVDPEVLCFGDIRRLSELSENYRKFLEEEKSFLENNCYSELLK